MNKIKLTLILITVLTASALGGVIFVYGQEADPAKTAAENLLTILSERENTISSLFDQIVEDGGEVTEKALEAFEEAQELHVNAQVLFDEGKYEDSLDKATDALNEYTKAEANAGPEEPEQLTVEQQETQEDTDKMVGLFTAIKKARERIKKLRDIADDLGIPNFETSEAESMLIEASSKLEEIYSDLEESGDLDESEIVLGEAIRLIGQATGKVKSYGAPGKQLKLQHFVEKTMLRMAHLEEKMTRIAEKRGVAVEDLSGQFGGIFAGLAELDLDSDLTHDDMKSLIQELKGIMSDAKKIGKPDVEGGFGIGAVNAMNAQTSLEVIIEEFRTQVSSIEGNEELVAELLGLLDEAEALLTQAEEALVTGDEVLAEELTDAAEDLVEQFEELFDEYDTEGSSGKGNSASSNGKGKPSETPNPTTN